MRKQLTDTQVAVFRARLIKTAEKLFAARGVGGITMREIARALGYSQTAAYRYFANKDEIVGAVRAAILDRFCARLEQAFLSETNARGRARAVGRAYLQFAEDEPDSYRLIFNSDLLHSVSPDFKRALDRLYQTMTGYVESLIAEGNIEGNAFELGKAFQTAAHGVIMMHLGGALPTIEARDALHRSMMRLIYRGAMRVGPAAGPAKSSDPTIAKNPAKKRISKT
jgi:AcrR family transcriptional regulator